MERILICTATEAEIAPLLAFLQKHSRLVHPHEYQYGNIHISILITGVGMMSTAFALGRRLQEDTCDAALMLGIAGAFNRSLALGDLVQVASERYGDLGAEDHDAYIDITELGFLPADDFPFQKGAIAAPMASFPLATTLPKVNSISINTVSGNTQSIAARTARYQADIESMEGIAFHYACARCGIPYVQVRAISNYIIPRDRSQWEIGKAIGNLNQWAIQLLEELAMAI